MSLAIDLEPLTPSTPQELIMVGLVLVCLGVMAWRRAHLNRIRVDRRVTS